MKIVYLLNQLYLHGGGEKIVALKMNALVNHPHYQVYFLTTNQKNNKPIYWVDEKVHWTDLKINYQVNRSYFHPSNLVKTVTHFFKLKKQIRKIQPDLIISVSQSPEQFFLPFIQKKIPKIKEFHSSGANYGKPKGLVQKMKHQLFNLYKKYTVLVVLNNDEKQYYPFENVTVIPNFIQLKSNQESDKRKNIILAAGRIAPVKQFDHLIKAWSLIAKKFPDWEVHIYGEGDELLSNQLKTLIHELDVQNIYLKGATNILETKMKEASIYALTSATECFPMVLLESLSCGLPIVSYDCPHGPNTIITNLEDGILVEHNNFDALSVELSNLIENSSKRKIMGDKARNNVKRFSENLIMEKWIQLFKELV